MRTRLALAGMILTTTAALAEPPARPGQPRIIDLAFQHPAMTITDIAAKIGVTYQAAANNVAVLVGAGVASEIGSHPKVIVFDEILEALRVE